VGADKSCESDPPPSGLGRIFDKAAQNYLSLSKMKSYHKTEKYKKHQRRITRRALKHRRKRKKIIQSKKIKTSKNAVHNVEIVTHLSYTELFNNFDQNGIVLHSNSLKTENDIKKQIFYLLREMNPIELIQFSSFLNMICQSYGFDMARIRGITLMKETFLVPQNAVFKNKILFHRENLLNLIGQIISNEMIGVEQLTGPGHLTNQQKYTRALLFNNDLLNIGVRDAPTPRTETVLRDYCIREWPHYYISETSKTVNGHRIIRYRHCYEELLPSLIETKKRVMQTAIQAFEQSVGVSLHEYLHVITGLYCWFLDWPVNREKNNFEQKKPKYGFDFKDIRTFYINTEAFKEDPAFLKTIEALSKDINALKIAAATETQKERDSITGYNQLVRVFFDNPIFKISKENYCIIDLKFALENACGGLLWKLRTNERIQDFKSAYGYMMEEYFKLLISKIFTGEKITFGDNGGADAIIETKDAIIVMEFTTEYYKMASLYNDSVQDFLDDSYKILFNTGSKDKRGRGKNDPGKLLKLNDYVLAFGKSGKTVIPVLVTENLLGNPDLFNEFSNFFSTEIIDKKLSYLEHNTPLFLCLDDLETFWGLFQTKDSVEGFVGFVRYWNSAKKGPQLHNASSGICRYVEGMRDGEARIINKEYAEFFSPQKVYAKESSNKTGG